MYIHRHAADDALAVWVFQASTPQEWDAHFEHLREVATWSGKAGRRGATMLIARDFSRPDAQRRTELAQLTEAAGYDPYVAFVSPSAALRAVLTMFGWVQKAPRYEMDFFGSSEGALGWLEKKRGGSLEKMRSMLTDIRAQYKKETGLELP